MAMNLSGFALGAAGGRIIRLLTLCFSLIFFAACFPFSGELPHEKMDSGASQDGPPCGMEPGLLPCRPPMSTSSADGDPVEATFAITDVLLDQKGVDPPIGLDLDGIDGSAGSPTQDQGECGATEGARDAKFGIDNVLGMHLWPDLAGVLKIECEVERTHKRGLGTLLIHISNWNGNADDAEVTVTVVSAIAGFNRPGWRTQEDAQAAAADWDFLIVNTGTEEEPSYDLPIVLDADGNPVEDEPCWTPNHTTNDWFFANPRSFTSQYPNVRTTRGYVSDYRLVVPLDVNAPIELMTDRRGVSIPLVGGYLVGDIVDNALRLENAYIAGRFRVSEIVEVGEAIGFCGEDFTGIYSGYADLFRAIPSSFLEGAPVISDTPCTSDGVDGGLGGAVSVGVGFSGVRVSYAGLPPRGVKVYDGEDGDEPLVHTPAKYHAPGDGQWKMPDACQLFELLGEDAVAAPPECAGDYSFTPGAHCN